MKTLWFKQIYVVDILARQKTDTYRKPSTRLPRAGDRIALTVGPRPPFAVATVESVTPVEPHSEKADELAGIYGPGGTYVRVAFNID
jgi:hypothetical protein